MSKQSALAPGRRIDSKPVYKRRAFWITLAIFFIGLPLVSFYLLGRALWNETSYQHSQVIYAATRVAVAEMVKTGEDVRELNKTTCKTPLTRFSPKYSHYLHSEVKPPLSNDQPPNFFECIMPVTAGAKECAWWRWEYCDAVVFHEYVLNHPQIFGEVVAALSNPCAYRESDRVKSAARAYYRLAYAELYGSSPEIPVELRSYAKVLAVVGRSFLDGNPHTCENSRSIKFVITVVNDDGQPLRRLTVAHQG